MRFLIKLFLVSFIGTVAMFGALGSENQWPGLIVAFTVWILFIWSMARPSRKERQMDGERERIIGEIMRKLDQRGF